jgi:hypothetical protein
MIEKRVTDKANEVIFDLMNKIQSTVNQQGSRKWLDSMTSAVQRLTWFAETKQETKSEGK